jgi:hypothetical protein
MPIERTLRGIANTGFDAVKRLRMNWHAIDGKRSCTAWRLGPSVTLSRSCPVSECQRLLIQLLLGPRGVSFMRAALQYRRVRWALISARDARNPS